MTNVFSLLAEPVSYSASYLATQSEQRKSKMQIPDIYRDVIDGLVQATKEGRVAWAAKSAGSTAFVNLSDFDLEIWGGTDENNDGFVSVGLREKGNREFSDSWYCEQADEDYAKMRDLYTEALRKAKGIDTKLNKLRELLQSKHQVGTPPNEIPF